jgi:hypothetical protein
MAKKGDKIGEKCILTCSNEENNHIFGLLTLKNP